MNQKNSSKTAAFRKLIGSHSEIVMPTSEIFPMFLVKISEPCYTASDGG